MRGLEGVCCAVVPKMEMGTQASTNTQILKDATLFFSRATPNLAVVIPAMDKIDRRFNEVLKKSTIDSSIKSAVRLALATLNRYYSLTDTSEAYRIAMSALIQFFYCSRTYRNTSPASPP